MPEVKKLMKLSDGVKLRAQIDTETTKTSLFINGGAAIALLALLPSILDRDGYRPFAYSIIVAEMILVIGLFCVVAHSFYRRKCSLIHEEHGMKPPGGRLLRFKFQKPTECVLSLTFLYASMAFFVIATLTVGIGGLRTLEALDQPTRTTMANASEHNSTLSWSGGEAVPQIAYDCTGWFGASLCFAYNWQTIIASGIALTAALWTVCILNRQIRDERQRYADARKSKAWAARAHLPDALSEIGAYTVQCMEYVMAAGETDRQQPVAPSEAMNTIKSGIEFFDPQSAQKIYELIAFYQVHNARLRDPGPRDTPENVDRMHDTARLRALTDRLFDFARDKVEKVADKEIDCEDMLSALRSAIGVRRYYDQESRFAPIVEVIERRYLRQGDG